MTSVSQALKSLRPTSEFICIGEDYSTVIWKDEENLKPEKVEVDAEISRLQAEYDSKEYQRLRALEYPSIQDQLDMQYHDALNGTTTWQDAINAVKDKYPKPEGV
jgi:hypothetical protein